MLFFNGKSKSLNVFFLKEHHFQMLKSKKIPLSHLPYLLFHNLSKEDVLDWIKYQRSIEKKYFNRTFTTYNKTGDLKYLDKDIKFDLELLEPELEEVYNDNKYYDELPNTTYCCENDTIIILSRETGLIEPNFKYVNGNPITAIYEAVLNTIGYHDTYFKEPVRDKLENGVELSEIIAILTK